ncbi:MAG: hypothetical protein U0792_22785 [Gemmataceae bacterium]
MNLLPHHLDELAKSGITPETAAENGLYSATEAKDVAGVICWSAKRAAALGSALVYPHVDASGLPMGHAIVKPDKPRQRKDVSLKIVKYESPRGKPNACTSLLVLGPR